MSCEWDNMQFDMTVCTHTSVEQYITSFFYFFLLIEKLQRQTTQFCYDNSEEIGKVYNYDQGNATILRKYVRKTVCFPSCLPYISLLQIKFFNSSQMFHLLYFYMYFNICVDWLISNLQTTILWQALLNLEEMTDSNPLVLLKL